MKKIIAAIVLVLFMVPMASATDSKSDAYQLVRAGIDVDYFTAAMGQVNTELARGPFNTSVTKLGGGIGAMADLDLAILPYVMLGARAGYLYSMPGSNDNNYIIYSQKTTLDSSLIPIEVGGCINLDIPSFPASIMAGIYGGYGIATASYQNEVNALGQTTTYTDPYMGGGFVGEILARVSIKMSSALSFNINGGYRTADIAQMKQTTDVNSTIYPTVPSGPKNKVLTDSNNNNMAFDYIGLSLGVGVALSY
jgi:hypothetical protein